MPLTSDETGRIRFWSRATAWIDVADREPDGEPRAPLELDDLGAAAPWSWRRGRRPCAEVQPGNFSSGKPAGLRGRPDRDHAVAVLAEDRGRDLRRRQPSASAIRLRNRAESSCVPRPITWRGGQAELRRRQVGQHVDRVRDDEDDRVLLRARGLDLAEDVQEQLDVAVDQVEPALVGLAPEAGGDADEVALGDRLVAGRPGSAGRPRARRRGAGRGPGPGRGRR